MGYVLSGVEGGGKKILYFKNEELDRKIGGIPLPSLIIVEGPNDSGKSVLTQQLIYGALESGFKVCYISSEGSGRYILSAMENLGFKVKQHYLLGNLGLISIHVKGMEWTHDMAETALNSLLSYIKYRYKKYEVFAIDSLTILFTWVREEAILKFLSEVRMMVDESGVSMILTLHHYALNQEQLVRIRSVSDTHFLLSIREVGDKLMKTLQVLKVRGATKSSSVILSFDVEPDFGIKVLPFAQVKA